MLSAVPLPLGSSIKFVVSGPSGIGSLNCVLFRFLERLERRITAGIGSEALRVGNLKSLKKTAFQGEAKLEAVEREKENGPAVASYGKCPGRQYPGPGDEPPLGGGSSTVGAHILDRWRTAWNRRLVSFNLFTRPDNRIRGTGIEGCHYRRLPRLGPRLAPRESGRMTASFLVPGSDASHCNGFAETLYLMIKHVRSPLPSPPLFRGNGIASVPASSRCLSHRMACGHAFHR
ncbi:hypothetical protein J2861_005235 [Agrobacterium tumefaciens]|nr:hypothetical protein [Agrobacterium tumefaciens]